MSCSVLNCPSLPGKNLSFFNFPDHKSEEYNKWIKFCGRPDNWIIKEGYQVCELHFRDSDKNGLLLMKALRESANQEGTETFKSNVKSCRVCLNDCSRDLLSLFSTLTNGVTVAHILEYCTSVEVRLNDSYPQFVCKHCLDKLKVAEEIKRLTLKTDGQLKSSDSSAQKTKNEPIFVKIEPA